MPLTPTLVGSVCYSSVTVAADAYFGAIPTAVSINGAITTVVQHVFYIPAALPGAGYWTIKSISYNATGIPSTNFWRSVTAPAFPGCDVSQPYLDGIEIGWGVAAAMFSALAIIFLKKSFYR